MKQIAVVETTTSSRPAFMGATAALAPFVMASSVLLFGGRWGGSKPPPCTIRIRAGSRLWPPPRRGSQRADAAPLDLDDLGELDHAHYGGRAAVEALARRAALRPGARVLDVCAGLAGPPRFLAGRFGGPRVPPG